MMSNERTVMWMLALLILTGALAACSGGSGSASDAYGERNPVEIAGSAVTVELTNLQFTPRGMKIKPGTTVTWLNKDAALHNVREIDSAFLSQDEMSEGDMFSYTFETPGTFRYQCTFHHPNMNGVVIVEDV